MRIMNFSKGDSSLYVMTVHHFKLFLAFFYEAGNMPMYQSMTG